MDFQALIMKIKIQETIARARLDVLETVIADFLRLHLSHARDTPEDFAVTLTAMSEKLLQLQVDALQAQQNVRAMAGDIMAGAEAHQREQLEAIEETAAEAAEG